MAGSRLEKIGTVFSRVTGLLRSGALKEEDRPIWYDVYKSFPPKYEPRIDRPVKKVEIRNILYSEDKIRAKFYKAFPNIVVDLTSSRNIPLTQRFVEKYFELEQQGNREESELFQATVEALSLKVSENTVRTSQKSKDMSEPSVLETSGRKKENTVYYLDSITWMFKQAKEK